MRWGISLSFHLQLLEDVGLQHATISQTTCRYRLDMPKCLKWHWMPAFKPLGCFPSASCYPKESFSWTLKEQEGRGYDSFFCTSPSGSHWRAQNSRGVKQKMAFLLSCPPSTHKKLLLQEEVEEPGSSMRRKQQNQNFPVLTERAPKGPPQAHSLPSWSSQRVCTSRHHLRCICCP